MIKYSIIGLVGEDKDNYRILNKISISIFSEDDNNKEVFKDTRLLSREGKITMTAPVDGQYRICFSLFELKDSLNKVKIKIQILSENMDEPNLLGAVKTDQITEVHKKITSILEKGEMYNKKLQKITNLEDQDAAATIKSQKTFYYTTLIQIAIVIFLGIFQIFNIKSFLEKN